MTHEIACLLPAHDQHTWVEKSVEKPFLTHSLTHDLTHRLSHGYSLPVTGTMAAHFRNTSTARKKSYSRFFTLLSFGSCELAALSEMAFPLYSYLLTLQSNTL